MTIDTQSYRVPDGIVTLKADSFDQAPAFDPALTTLKYVKKRTFLAYRWCYLDRVTLDVTVTSTKKREKVNLLSFSPQRLEVVRSLINDALVGDLAEGLVHNMDGTFDWIDRQGRDHQLYTLESCKTLYRDYTADLMHRLRLSNVGGKKQGAIKAKHASGLQGAMAQICSAAISLPVSTVKTWDQQISQHTKGFANDIPTPATTETEHSSAHAMHRQYFMALTEALLTGATPPVVIELESLGFEDVIYYNDKTNSANGWVRGKKGLRVDWMPYFYRREGVFKGTWTEFNRELAKVGIEPDASIRKSYRILQSKASHFSPATRVLIANNAARHFGYLLMGEAGIGAQQLGSLECSTPRLDKETGSNRIITIKARAGHEEQAHVVDLRFTQTIWKRYLQLREWMSERLREKGVQPPIDGVFLIGNGRRSKEPFSLVDDKVLKACSLWPKHGPSLASRPARKHKTVNLIEGSGGNVSLVAAMQVANPRTIERHYAFKNVQEAHREMSAYFDLQAKSASLRASGVKPIPVIQAGDDTSTGHCATDVAQGPRLVEGLEHLDVEPRCTAPLTCLFCVHFGLHAEEEELLRLLTIKQWVETQSRLSSVNIDENRSKYMPYIERIDQVFTELPETYPAFANALNQAQSRFEKGQQDLYWAAKINALLDLEDDA